MLYPRVNPTTTRAWGRLVREAQWFCRRPRALTQLFDEDPTRATRYCLQVGPLYLDYAKNLVRRQTIDHLCLLADEVQFDSARSALMSGALINETERRCVGHMRLRHPDPPLEVSLERKKMAAFVAQLHSGALRGYSGEVIHSLVHIGIGGSGLGPKVVVSALAHLRHPNIRLHFVENIDPVALDEVLAQIDPAHTLFLVASKSFTTEESMRNAARARAWLQGYAGEKKATRQFVALTANPTAARAWGMDGAHIFRFWDWVGGRFSLWSAVGLPIACALGFDQFEALLKGAHHMDTHFEQAPLKENLPVLLALFSLWYANFFHAQSHAILCYSHAMRDFVCLIQQIAMESNGKSIGRDGTRLSYTTAPIIFGGEETCAQHSFHQLLHQGRHLVPCDFIAPVQAGKDASALLAHCFAQSSALMRGRTAQDVAASMKAEGASRSDIKRLRLHRSFTGNRPSNTLLLKDLSAESIGALIAAYEHKTFTEGVLWNVYSFDQWGVELGKTLAVDVQRALKDPSKGNSQGLDAATEALIKAAEHLRQARSKGH